MYFNLRQQKIYYQKVGKGKDLIILHGWKQDVSTWWPLVDLLKDSLTLWLIDLPGFGRSSVPDKAMCLEDYTSIISKFIKENNIKKPAILGHSFGGSVAIKLASKYPDSISKLILEASSGIRLKPTLFNRTAKVIAKLIRVLPNFLQIKRRLRSKFYQAVGSDYLGAGKMKSTFLKIIRQDLTNDARRIPHQTLIIWGEKDKTLPLKLGFILYKLIKNSRIEVIEETGHAPHIKNPALFTNYVKDFI